MGAFSQPPLSPLKMKRKALFVAVAAALCLLWFLFRRASHSGTGVSSAGSPSDSESTLRAFMGRFEEAARQGALTLERPVAERLAKVIADGDLDEIHRAFHEAVHERTADLDATRAACLDLLKHPDWFVRKLAAEALYTMGDASGFEVLRDLLTSPSPLMDGQIDQRITIAIRFGEWREKRAGPYMAEMYRKTGEGAFLTGIHHLGRKDSALDSISTSGSMMFESTAVEYGIAKAPETKSALESAFQRFKPQNNEYPYVAWALYQYDADPRYLSAIRELAETARMNPASDSAFSPGTRAFRCLASIRDPEVKRLMEDSLHSPSKNIRATAAASLLLVQEGKSEALRLFLKDHVGKEGGQRIDLALGYEMAAYLNDPDVNAAGEARDRTGAEGAWRLYGVKRKNWPVYPWADGLLILP